VTEHNQARFYQNYLAFEYKNCFIFRTGIDSIILYYFNLKRPFYFKYIDANVKLNAVDNSDLKKITKAEFMLEVKSAIRMWHDFLLYEIPLTMLVDEVAKVREYVKQKELRDLYRYVVSLGRNDEDYIEYLQLVREIAKARRLMNKMTNKLV